MHWYNWKLHKYHKGRWWNCHVFSHEHISIAQRNQCCKLEFVFSCYSFAIIEQTLFCKIHRDTLLGFSYRSVIFCVHLLLPGLYDSNMRPFCSNSQHHCYFSNKVFLQIKSTLANVVTSINEKCNISFTVCKHPK